MPDEPFKPIIASWDVSGETYIDMVNEAHSDANLLMVGSHLKTEIHVINCEPLETEDSRVISWKGKAIITLA